MSREVFPFRAIAWVPVALLLVVAAPPAAAQQAGLLGPRHPAEPEPPAVPLVPATPGDQGPGPQPPDAPEDPGPEEPDDPPNPGDDPAEPPGPGCVPPPPPQVCSDPAVLSAGGARALAVAAAEAVNSPSLAVVVADRMGRPLARYRRGAATDADLERALGLARTGAFFSNNQAPLSSRTVRFVSGIHFPPGIARTPNAALYGIENTNRGCRLNAPFVCGKEIVQPKSLRGIDRSLPCRSGGGPGRTAGCSEGPRTGKVQPFDAGQSAGPAAVPVDPGGLPVYSGRSLVGGIGVVAAGPNPGGDPGPIAEFAAFQALAATGHLPDLDALDPAVVFIDGIRLPFVETFDPPPGVAPGPPVAPADVTGVRSGRCVPDGFLVTPRAGSALGRGQVALIVQQAIDAAARTRAVIRLPPGVRSRMVIAVGDLDGSLLALYRMPDATVFSIDVAVAKARNVVWFSGPGAAADLDPRLAGHAVTNRTLSFGAQPLFPAGIDGTPPGPFFDLFRFDLANVCTQGSQAPNPNQNGVVFFPGSMPLYDGAGNLVGGLGISGDGVEQDDYVAFLGAAGFRPDEAVWADRVTIRGVRLPFLKLPRNPEG